MAFIHKITMKLVRRGVITAVQDQNLYPHQLMYTLVIVQIDTNCKRSQVDLQHLLQIKVNQPMIFSL